MNPDFEYMQRALKLAEKGQGRVHPNPMVGCVIVKGDKVVGEGFHTAFGKPHAEIEALKRAGAKAHGATLYVNLEPCAHWGKTPPCTEAIFSAGIKRVVAGMRDPNPQVAGKGFSFLKNQGVEVTIGALERHALELNRAFITWMKSKRPYVTLKAASSLDGKSATRSGDSKWITSSQSRSAGHSGRAEVDAIAIGIQTLLADNPSLTAHGKGTNPVRVIFDSRLKIPLTARVLKESGKTWLFCTEKASAAKVNALIKKGAHVFQVRANRQGQVDIAESLKVLAQEGIAHLLVEGGGTLHASFLETGVVDEVVWYLAPLLIGGRDATPAIAGLGVDRLSKAWRLKDLLMYRLGDDLCIRGKIR